MSYQSDNLDLEILEEGDPADLTTISDNFDKIDAVAGDIATIETSPTQSSHAAGEFLLYEGRLYKVTSAISAGGSLILGTNVSAANIGNELKSLRDSVGKWTIKGNANAFDATKSSLSNGNVYTDYSIISDTLGVSTFRIWRDGRLQFYDNGSQITLKFG